MRQIEREANQFAMALLMPEHLLKLAIEEIGLTGIDLHGDDVKKLAGMFQVEEKLMAFRLGQIFE